MSLWPRRKSNMGRILLPLAVAFSVSACVTGTPKPAPEQKIRTGTRLPESTQTPRVANGTASPTSSAPTTSSVPPSPSDSAQVAQSLITPQQKPVIPPGVPSVNIALLLPLSDDTPMGGQSMLDAAALAVYDSYISLRPDQVNVRVVLLPKNSGSTPAEAEAATKDVLEKGASVIIGPLLSSSVSAAAPLAKAKGVPVLSLSNNRAVASKGVYTFGFSPEEQVKRVVDFASLKNIQSIAALVPNDAYGRTVADSLKSILTARGNTVAALEPYGKAMQNRQGATRRLSEAYAKKPFQAVMLAEGGEELGTMLGLLSGANLTPPQVQLLGTGVWDEETIGQVPGLTGAWFASIPPASYAAFGRRFQAAYGYKPTRLASLTYDATALATSLALKYPADMRFSEAKLETPQGFQGAATGRYRLNNDGTVERALAVLEVTPAGHKIVSPAAREFKK